MLKDDIIPDEPGINNEPDGIFIHPDRKEDDDAIYSLMLCDDEGEKVSIASGTYEECKAIYDRYDVDAVRKVFDIPGEYVLEFWNSLEEKLLYKMKIVT